MITISAFNWVPERFQGQVRDLYARWALEEAGLEYRVKLIDHEQKQGAEYRAWQPFSQVPAYDDGEARLFEVGAIVLHIASRSDVLFPSDPQGRARTVSWVIAALNSVAPPLRALFDLDQIDNETSWVAPARPHMEAAAKKRLDDVGEYLQDRQWLVDRFTAADIVMTMPLRENRHNDLVRGHPVMGPYLERCQARPAFQRALAAQMADFREPRKVA